MRGKLCRTCKYSTDISGAGRGGTIACYYINQGSGAASLPTDKRGPAPGCLLYEEGPRSKAPTDYWMNGDEKMAHGIYIFQARREER